MLFLVNVYYSLLYRIVFFIFPEYNYICANLSHNGCASVRALKVILIKNLKKIITDFKKIKML